MVKLIHGPYNTHPLATLWSEGLPSGRKTQGGDLPRLDTGSGH